MALYSYKKAPIKIEKRNIPAILIGMKPPVPPSQEDSFVIPEPPKPKHVDARVIKPKKNSLTIGMLFSRISAGVNGLLVESKIAGIFIPIFFVVVGVIIIFNQVWPGIEEKIRLSQGYYSQESTALVKGEYFSKNQYLSNPGSNYFEKLTLDAEDSPHTVVEDTLSNNYQGRFSITIESLDLINLPVTANVDSSQESVYRRVLVNTLAHFKGTSLPISSVNKNIVIYGHSSSGDYYERTKDIAGAFSRLNRIKVGDIVEITMEGVSYKFRIAKSKIVEPFDVEILHGIPNKRMLTLFTCFPNGNNAQRFVAIGYPV